MTGVSSNGNELVIDDDDDLWRRVHPKQIFYDENLERFRPMSGTFKQVSMSVYIAKLVLSSGRDPHQILQHRYEDYGLASFTAGLARGLNQDVVFDPPDEGGPEKDPAHGLVVGKKSKTIQDKFASECDWVVLPEKSC